MLRSSSINKVTMVNILMQENTYDEMHTIYAKVPGIFKSIFTLPYLKRKSYSEVYGTGYILQKDNIVEYIGILAFVFELNHKLLNKFVQLRQKFEDNLLIGNYNLAYQYLNEINISTTNTVPIPIRVFITALYIFCPVVYDGLIAPFSSV